MPVGLGHRINTDVPTIDIPEGSVRPGDFLQGSENRVVLDVQQQFGLRKVYMKIWYTCAVTGIPRAEYDPLIIPATQNEDGEWVVNINTEGMADGTIRTRVSAVDVDGNRTTTTDLIYNVKNTPPQIELSVPRISGVAFDNLDNHPVLRLANPIFQGNDIMGIASDLSGIAPGFPQIMFWPLPDPDPAIGFPGDLSGEGIDPVTGMPAPGTLWYVWHPLLDDQGTPFSYAMGVLRGATQFRWPLVQRVGGTTTELPTGHYGFRIRVKDYPFGTVNYYPNRINNTVGPYGTRLPANSAELNQFMQLQIIASVNPIIRWAPAFEPCAPNHCACAPVTGIPSDYTGFPVFHSGAEDLVVFLTITSGNPLTTRRAALRTQDTITNWGDLGRHHVDVMPVPGTENLFQIRITPQQIREMLGAASAADITGDRILHIEAMDREGNRTNTNRLITIDAEPPTLEFIEPLALAEEGNAPPYVFGGLTFRGSAQDNQRVARMYYALGRTDTAASVWTNTGLSGTPQREGAAPGHGTWAGTLSSWSWRFTDIADLLPSVALRETVNENRYVTRIGTENLWDLPIRFRIVDTAGNIRYVDRRVIIDPDQDLPISTITFPTPLQIVGGPIRIDGNTTDNEMVYEVRMRIYKQQNSIMGNLTPTDVPDGPWILHQNWTTILNSSQAGGRASVNWHAMINENGELNPPDDRDIRVVRVEFYAYDTSPYAPGRGRPGRITQRYLQISNDVPVISRAAILWGAPSGFPGSAAMNSAADEIVALPGGTQDPRGVAFDDLSNATMRGSATMRIRVRASAGLERIRLRNPPHPLLDVNIQAADFSSDSEPWAIRMPNNYYTIFIPLNTTGAQGVTRFGSGFAGQAAIFPLEVHVTDNAGITGQTPFRLHIDNRPPFGGFSGDLTVIRSAHTLRGTAWDHAPGVQVHGIDRVLLSFSRNGIPYTQPERTGIAAQLNRTPDPIEWFYNFDFSGFADGKLTVNYTVIDHAGNETHLSQDIFLAINRPVLQSISLGTQLGHAYEFAQPITDLRRQIPGNFRVRNNDFRLRLALQNNTGTGAITHDVAFATRTGPHPASEMQQGYVYTVANRGTRDWVNYGVFFDAALNPVGITFVAIRPGNTSTTGTVYRWHNGTAQIDSATEALNTATRKRDTWTTDTTITFSNSTPSSFSGNPRPIPDSQRDLVPGGVNFVLRNDRFFIVRVSDASGISDATLVRVDIHNDDTTPPVIQIAHFGRMVHNGETVEPNFAGRQIVPVAATAAGYNMNIAMIGGTRLGYVQHHEHSANPALYRADISGRVIFRGKAMDNNRIQSITATVGTPGAAVSGGTTAQGITTGGTVSGTPVTIATWSPGANGLIPDPNIPAAWAFNTSAQTNTLDFGHVFNWEIEWDSSTLTGVVGENVPITFAVTDFANVTSSQTIRVNVVPYITEIVTPLSQTFRQNPSAFNRSARGWYPVRENDTITLRGFNLGGTGAATAVTLNGTTITRPAAGSHPGDSPTLRVLNIGTTAASGPLVLTVTPNSGTGVASINNRNNNAAHYNQEPNNLNNNTLTDDRYFYVWRVGPFFNAGLTSAIPGSTGSGTAPDFPYLNPVMQMNPNSDWVFAFGGSSTNQGEIWVARNSNTPSPAIAAANRWRHIGVSLDAFGNQFTIGSNQTAGSDQFSFVHRIGTGIWRQVNSNAAGTQLPPAGGDRFMLPRIATQTTGGNAASTTNPVRVALSYFDTLDNANNNLRFNFGVVTGDSAATLNAPQVVANNSTTHQGSMFSAVGFLSTGRPVVAWFDRTNMNLVLSYGNAAPATGTTTLPTTTDQWQANARIVHSLAGSHVDMAIDGDNNIHLAYFDALNGGLYYARIPSPAGIPNVGAAQIVRVDSFLSAGTRVMINVRRETHTGGITRYVPYISYFHASFDETRSSVRVAWQRTFPLAAGSDQNDRLTGAWEVMTVPVNNVPASGNIIANGVPTSGTLSGTAGLQNAAALPGVSAANDITRTMLVGYLTTHYFEGAILKYDIVSTPR